MTVENLSVPRRHSWEDKGYRHRDDTPSHCDEHERQCKLCFLTKITVHVPQGFPERAWRTKGGVRFPDNGKTPLCEDAPE